MFSQNIFGKGVIMKEGAGTKAMMIIRVEIKLFAHGRGQYGNPLPMMAGNAEKFPFNNIQRIRQRLNQLIHTDCHTSLIAF
jgi:hypothetical protein